MIEAVKASGTDLVTVALRRFNRAQAEDDLYGPLSSIEGLRLVPNTSGAMNAKEAIRAAQLGRELSKSPFVKLELPNPHHLLPDPIETYEAALELTKEGFIVLPYMPADPVLAKRLRRGGLRGSDAFRRSDRHRAWIGYRRNAALSSEMRRYR